MSSRQLLLSLRKGRYAFPGLSVSFPPIADTEEPCEFVLMEGRLRVFGVWMIGLGAVVFALMAWLQALDRNYWPTTADVVGCWTEGKWRFSPLKA